MAAAGSLRLSASDFPLTGNTDLLYARTPTYPDLTDRLLAMAFPRFQRLRYDHLVSGAANYVDFVSNSTILAIMRINDI
jgi:hypothetical protein